jgi:hypothetical protein
MATEERSERFSTRPALRAATVIALCFWLLVTVGVVLAALSQSAAVTLGTIFGLLFFDLLFLASSLYYHHRRIIVDNEGIVVTGAMSFREYPWHEVLHVNPDPGYFPGYEVVTRRGVFGFLGIEFPGSKRLFAWFERNRNRRPPPPSPPPPSRQGISASEAALGQHRRRAARRRRTRR